MTRWFDAFLKAWVIVAILFGLVHMTGCGPSLIVPAEGSRLSYGMCGQTSNGILVMTYEAKCPDLARVTERARRVKEIYRDCALDGVRIHVVGAHVMCDGEAVRACTTGNLITITADTFVIPAVSHELAHVCIEQRYGPGSLAAFDHDNRRERLNRDKRDRNPLGLGMDD